MGRHALLTDELLANLVEQLKLGIPVQDAAAYVGINRQTLWNWTQRGKHAVAKLDEGGTLTKQEQAYLEAAEQIEVARDYGAAWLVHQILDAAGGEKGQHLKKWQAYMTILERTRPHDYRRRSSAEYIERDKLPAVTRIDVSKLDLEERQALRGLLSKARGAE